MKQVCYFERVLDIDLFTRTLIQDGDIALSRIDRYEPARGTMLTWLTYLSRNHIKRARRHLAREQSASDWEQLDAQLVEAYKNLAEAPLPDELLAREELTALVQMTMSSPASADPDVAATGNFTHTVWLWWS